MDRPESSMRAWHLDVRVADRDVRGGERARRIEEQVERLTGVGGTVAWREDDIHGNGVVMRDPEGIEFCVA